MDDPVVGWLVITDGPGKGNYLKLGYGQNTIGRSDNRRVTLDFGDDEISRENHAILIYDSRSKAFYLRQDQGVNLAYLHENGEHKPVLEVTG